tara:strand:- start:3035 stop:3757 length:723 start_codon:yes stop_codon:yes gene_type:complete
MKYFLNLILFIIDFGHKKKIINFLKKSLSNKSLKIIDVGAHYGETLKLFLKYFNIDEFICYEASKDNFFRLKKLTDNFRKRNLDIKIYNKPIGDIKRLVTFNQTSESSSSTFSKINFDTKYFKRKNFILKFFFGKNYISKSYDLELSTLKEEIKLHKLKFVDLLKIDTEGFEFEIIKGLQDKIEIVKYIYFEHHFDQMIVKNYTFGDINQLLLEAGFKKVFKVKMPFRKTFEYIYVNKRN